MSLGGVFPYKIREDSNALAFKYCQVAVETTQTDRNCESQSNISKYDDGHSQGHVQITRSNLLIKLAGLYDIWKKEKCLFKPKMLYNVQN